MEFVPLVGIAALIAKGLDLLKFIQAADVNAAITQVTVWVLGVGVTVLAAATDYATAIVIGELALADMNPATLVFVGLNIGSVGSLAIDFKKAFDSSDTAAMPALTRLSGGKAVPPP